MKQKMGVSLGLTINPTNDGILTVAAATYQYLPTIRLIVKLLISQGMLNRIKFTSIQLNNSYQTAVHQDDANWMSSWIIAVGIFTGGMLYIHNGIEAEVVDIHDIWYEFDGNMPHGTMPQGTMGYLTLGDHTIGSRPQDSTP